MVVFPGPGPQVVVSLPSWEFAGGAADDGELSKRFERLRENALREGVSGCRVAQNRLHSLARLEMKSHASGPRMLAAGSWTPRRVLREGRRAWECRWRMAEIQWN